MKPGLPNAVTDEIVVGAILDLWAEEGCCDRFDIEGCSMAPLLRHGDSVLVAYGHSDCRLGDILVYRREARLVVHRLLAEQEDGSLLLGGDNEPRFDEPVPRERVLGRAIAFRVRRGQYRTDTWQARLLGQWMLLIARSRRYQRTWRAMRLLNALVGWLLFP